MTNSVLDLVFAFSAGFLTLFSPCAFPMLPGYISYYLGAKTQIERAVFCGAACSLGLLTVFITIGLIASALGNLITRYVPILELSAGLLTFLMGLSMVAETRIPIPSISLRAPRQKTLIGVYLYGVAYGLAALGCSAPVFLSALVYAMTLGGVLYGASFFTVYSLGIGLPLIITTILVARAKAAMLGRMTKTLHLVRELGGIILMAIGCYLVYYYIVVESAS